MIQIDAAIHAVESLSKVRLAVVARKLLRTAD